MHLCISVAFVVNCMILCLIRIDPKKTKSKLSIHLLKSVRNSPIIDIIIWFNISKLFLRKWLNQGIFIGTNKELFLVIWKTIHLAKLEIPYWMSHQFYDLLRAYMWLNRICCVHSNEKNSSMLLRNANANAIELN